MTIPKNLKEWDRMWFHFFFSKKTRASPLNRNNIGLFDYLLMIALMSISTFLNF